MYTSGCEATEKRNKFLYAWDQPTSYHNYTGDGQKYQPISTN